MSQLRTARGRAGYLAIGLASLANTGCGPVRLAEGGPLSPRLLAAPPGGTDASTGVFPDAPRMLEDWSPPRAAGQVMLLREPPPSRAWRPYGSVYNIAGTGEVEVTDRLLARAAAEGADGLLFQAGSAGPTTYSSTTAGGSYAANTRIGTIGLSNESTTTTAVTSYAALGQPITMRDPGSEAWIGAGCRSYVPGAADGAPASNSQASYVAEVVPQSPAAVAGLRVGDVVLGVAHDGRPTWALPCPALAAALAKAVGTRVELAVWRPSTDPAALLTVQVPPGHAGPLGIGATTFEAAEAQSVWVNVVDPSAYDLGLRIGDFILYAGERRVLSQRDLFEALARTGFPGASSGVALRIARVGKGFWLPVTVATVPSDRYRLPSVKAPPPPPPPVVAPPPPPPVVAPLPPVAAPAGCAKDVECKGIRICVRGECVDPKGTR